MATKLSELTALGAAPATTDRIPLVDVSDTTQAVSGTTKYVTAAQLFTSPALTTPTLGVATATSINKVAFTAPATSATLTLADGKTLTCSNTLTFTGTDASSVAFGAGGTVLYSGGALGTPSGGTLTNCTGLPIAGTTGYAAGIATFLATPSSANLISAVTDETGTGALVFANTPTLVTPVLGAATGTSLALGGGTALTTTNRTGTGDLVLATSPTITTPTLSGITVADGAQVQTASAMGALAVDVTKLNNTKSVSADSTLTFSGTPATAQTWFGIRLTNTDTAAHVITIPSSFSMTRNAAVTTVPVAASGKIKLIWEYDGSGYNVYGDSGQLNNYAATAAPAVTDDLDLGYGVGSVWIDVTGDDAYVCVDSSNGAAVWNAIGGGGSGTVTNTGGNLTSNAVVLGAGSADSKVVAGITTNGAAQLVLGVNATTIGTLKLFGNTSGDVTISPTAAAGTATAWTIPATSDTFVGKATTDTLTNKTLTSPVLTTPTLGTPASGTLTSCTGLPISTGVSGLGTGVATFLATPSSANLRSALTDETGTGAAVFATAPTTAGAIEQLNAVPGTDDTYEGQVIIGRNAGATIAQWEAVYLGSAGTWLLADANGTNTYPCRGLACAAYVDTNAATVIDNGVVRNDAWAWTVGGDIYLSGTAGGLTQTAPSTSGDKVQKIGYALSADSIRINIGTGEYLTVT